MSENGIPGQKTVSTVSPCSPYGLVSLELISFNIPSTGEKSTGIPFYRFFREALRTEAFGISTENGIPGQKTVSNCVVGCGLKSSGL